ncbi:MAG TPA: DUF5069 domain-containing protein [Candidatus Elarobacter sp.]|jgi:hypothetical protein|nr:DUF5069 domain-containing protein [Candidatus Elarobacter sp.]
MQPLDLRFRPPRGPRETMLGLYFLPRTLDKLRAEMPGGSMGPYLNEPRGISAFLCRRLGIDMEDLRAEVIAADDEDEVVAWLRERIDPAKVEETNRKLESLTIERLSPEDQEMVRHHHPILAQRPELVTFLDIFEADDAATYESYR